LLKQFIGNSPVQEGRVVLQIPRLTDNGLSVPLKVSVESAMNVNDHVLQLLLQSNRNPRPLIAAFEFGPESSKPNFLTRVRLGGSQTVFALAQMSDVSW
jgi:sulfur-oxidizing protein SoxY